MFDGSLPFISALLALLAGVAIGKAWERYKLRDGRWIDRRKARDSQHYVLGLNFLVANQIDLAIEELSQAARVDADALEIDLILGNVYRERGQVTRAIQVHQALLQRQKLTRLEHAYVMLCLGLDFKRGGFVDRAVEAFKEVRRLDPANTYALLHLEKVYEEQHQWDDAARIRQELVALDGPEPPARSQAILAFLENERGMSALKAGDFATAEARFRAALDLDGLVTPGLGQPRRHAGARGPARRGGPHLGRPGRDHARARPPRARSPAPGLPGPRRAGPLPRPVPAPGRGATAELAGPPRPGRRAGQPRVVRARPGSTARGARPQPARPGRARGDLGDAAPTGPDRAQVERYVRHAKDAVFFLDPHVCLRCRYRSTELLWQCPHCHEWNSFVEERIAPVKEAAEL